MYGKGKYRKDHYRFVEAFKHKAGQVFATWQIEEIMLKKFPTYKRGGIRPNDHGKGNKGACPCAGTDDRIFDRDRIGLYKVK